MCRQPDSVQEGFERYWPHLPNAALNFFFWVFMLLSFACLYALYGPASRSSLKWILVTTTAMHTLFTMANVAHIIADREFSARKAFWTFSFAITALLSLLWIFFVRFRHRPKHQPWTRKTAIQF